MAGGAQHLTSFRGSFSEDEKDLIQAALQVLHERRPEPSLLGYAWMVLKEEVNGRPLLIAHRARDGHVLTAGTALELIAKINSIDQQAP